MTPGGRFSTVLLGLAVLASAGCIGDAYLDATKLFPDGDTSTGSDTSTTSNDPPTSTSPGETGVQTVTSSVDAESSTGLPSDPGTTGELDTSSGEPTNLPPTIEVFTASDYIIDEAGPLTLTLNASDDKAVVSVRLYLDGEEIPGELTLASFPYIHHVLSAKDNGDARKFKVVVEDAEGLTAEAETPPITMLLPESGAERCVFEDPGKGSVDSGINAVEYTTEAIFAVGTRGLKLALWKLDPDNCQALPGWPKTIANWTGSDDLKGPISLGTAVDVDENGNVVVAGNLIVNNKTQPYVALLTADGGRLWERAGGLGEEVAGGAAGIGLHHNRVFVVGSQRTNDNPVRTDGAVWIYHFDGDSVIVAPPIVLKAPFTPEEFEKDLMNERSERVRAVVVQPGTGYALVVGEREFKINPDEVYTRSFVLRVNPTGLALGTPWTSTADASFVHDAARAVAVCDDGFAVSGWTRDIFMESEPSPMILWLDSVGSLLQRRSGPQMIATELRGVACDREKKVVSAGTRDLDMHDARVFAVRAPLDPRLTYDNGGPGQDGAAAVACDSRGFCGWGGYRTANAIPYAIVRVHHP